MSADDAIHDVAALVSSPLVDHCSAAELVDLAHTREDLWDELAQNERLLLTVAATLRDLTRHAKGMDDAGRAALAAALAEIAADITPQPDAPAGGGIRHNIRTWR